MSILRAAVAIARQVIGTQTNDNATAGNVGEYVTATVVAGSAVALATGVTSNVTQISLTAGDWDIDAQVDFTPGATTSVTQWNAGVSLTSATLAAQTGGSGLGTDPTATINQPAEVPVSTVAVSILTTRLSIAATTTVFLVANGAFTVSTLAAYGTIRARRMR